MKLNIQELEFGTDQFCFDDRLELDLEMFDIEGLEDDTEVEDDSMPSYYMKPKLAPFRKTNIRYDHAEELAQDLKIGFGDRANVVVSGNFVYGDFLEAWLVESECQAVRCYISTLSMSEQNVNSLKALKKNEWIVDMHMFLSSYFYAHEQRGLMPIIMNGLDDGSGRFQCSISSMHVKVILLEMADGRFITMHGSANLRSSACIEQLCIEEGKELFDFYKELFDNIEEKYKIINKSLRRNQAWKGLDKKVIKEAR